jgi:predicted phosphodiesterase
MIKPYTKADIARTYRDEHGMEMPTLKLARIMYNENKLVFKDVEDARSSLRAIEGKAKVGLKVTHPYPERPKNPYNLPESDAETFEPFVMPYYERIGILNDIHLPYHDLDALSAAIGWLQSQNPNAIFLNGDILDFHQLSYFEKDPKKKNFGLELDIFADFMDKLTKIFNVPVYYKFGNHEERYDKFLKQKAKELVGVKEFDLENIIKARANCTVIRDKRIVVINGLPYVHGHEFGRAVFSPVNAARGLFMQAKHSCVKGDCHTTSEHTEPDIFGKIMTTYSVGALCGLHPDWLPINKWNHGCALQINNGDKYLLVNKRIYKGEVI